jgi:hypothetical protein
MKRSKFITFHEPLHAVLDEFDNCARRGMIALQPKGNGTDSVKFLAFMIEKHVIEISSLHFDARGGYDQHLNNMTARGGRAA